MTRSRKGLPSSAKGGSDSFNNSVTLEGEIRRGGLCGGREEKEETTADTEEIIIGLMAVCKEIEMEWGCKRGRNGMENRDRVYETMEKRGRGGIEGGGGALVNGKNGTEIH